MLVENTNAVETTTVGLEDTIKKVVDENRQSFIHRTQMTQDKPRSLALRH